MKNSAKKILIISAIALVFGILSAQCVYASGFLYNTLTEILADIGNIILGLCAWVLYLAALLFDYAVSISINGSLTQFTVIHDIWAITRDLANLFFIFIALYIGIATILGIGGHGVKDILVKLIIIALLVNFSFFIAKTVIDASNVLAMEFYTAIRPAGTVEIAGGEIGGLAAVFAQGLNPQTIYNIENTNFGKTGGREGTARQIIIMTVFGSAIILIAAFVLLAGGIMFVMRNVVLWLLMIFSPLAFIAMILPKTSAYAGQWQSKLLNQSFFAPAFLFLFYLVAKIINEGVLIKFFRADNATYAGLFLAENTSKHIGLIMVYVILIFLMLATLKVSNAMGAAGAGMVTDWGNKLKGAIQGYAGRLPGRMAVRMAAKPSQAFATGETKEGAGRITRAAAWLGKTTRKVPIAGRMATRGAAKIMGANIANIEKIGKDLETVNVGELEKIAQRPTSTGFTRIAALQQLAKRQKLENIPEQTVSTLRNLMERYGAPTMTVDKLKWQYSTPDKVVPNLTVGQFKEILDKGGKTSDKYLSYISNLAGAAGSLDDVAETLKKMENRAMASYMLSSAGAPIFKAYRGETAEEKPKEKSLLVDQYGRPLA